MTWFLVALATPVLHAIANHIDRHLILKYFKAGGVGALVVFSALFAAVALPIIILIKPELLSVSLINAVILSINGALIVLATLCYLYALQEDEASIVVPFFQIIPIFGFILGYFLLSETVTLIQLIGSLIIISGTILLAWEKGEQGTKIRWKVISLMLGASIFYAINGAVFKLMSIQEGFWVSTFWSLVGKVILGILILIFIKSYRETFFTLFRENPLSILLLNSFNESIILIGDIALVFALTLAPVGLVLTVSSVQPLFVFIIGLGITLMIPSSHYETIDRSSLFKKGIAIVLVIAGSFLLS